MTVLGFGTPDKPFTTQFPQTLLVVKNHVGADSNGLLDNLVEVKNAFKNKTDSLMEIWHGTEDNPKEDLPPHFSAVINSIRMRKPPAVLKKSGQIGKSIIRQWGLTMTGYCPCNKIKTQEHRDEDGDDECTTISEFWIPMTEFTSF